MSELEDIGRYYQLKERIEKAVAERNQYLRRCAGILGSAASAPVSRHNLARRCNFEAAQRLLEQARSKQAELDRMLSEITQVAPVANQPVPELE